MTSDTLSGRERERDPGLDAVVPFRFACHRCGNCCSGGSGYVWLADDDEGEVTRMAAHLGASVESFMRRYVRVVRDPLSGTERRSLREDERGRCALLVGANTCSLYDARPGHCRAFPYWPRVLTDRSAFEAARATCPGIAVEVDPEVRERAFERLEALHAALPREAEPRECCLDRADGARTFATALEADYALAAVSSTQVGPSRDAPDGGRGDSRLRHDMQPADRRSLSSCRRELGERETRTSACRLGERRPLACRIDADVDEKSGEQHLRDLRVIEHETGYPRAYGELSAMLRARGSTLEEDGA